MKTKTKKTKTKKKTKKTKKMKKRGRVFCFAKFASPSNARWADFGFRASEPRTR